MVYRLPKSSGRGTGEGLHTESGTVMVMHFSPSNLENRRQDKVLSERKLDDRIRHVQLCKSASLFRKVLENVLPL